MKTKTLKKAAATYLMMVICGTYLILSSGYFSSASAAKLYGGAVSGSCHECDPRTSCDTDQADPDEYCGQFLSKTDCADKRYLKNYEGRTRQTCQNVGSANDCQLDNYTKCAERFKCWWSNTHNKCNDNTGPYLDLSAYIECDDD